MQDPDSTGSLRGLSPARIAARCTLIRIPYPIEPLQPVFPRRPSHRVVIGSCRCMRVPSLFSGRGSIVNASFPQPTSVQATFRQHQSCKSFAQAFAADSPYSLHTHTAPTTALHSQTCSAMSSTATMTKTKSPAKVVALPSMTHSLSHLPTMHSIDPHTLHYGGLGASKEASQAKVRCRRIFSALECILTRFAPQLQQTLQRSSSGQSHLPFKSAGAPRKGSGGGDDGDYLMMGKVRCLQCSWCCRMLTGHVT
ncbi:hypothetical protein K439DRAFT_1088197 [Ramaria rubella]|nr:hypothetical protein K439DRAFT_1088197 [Ramaria rubella]